MKLPYAKRELERILSEIADFSCGKEDHTWGGFEIYNGKPEPELFKKKEKGKFLERVHSMNGHISKINLYLEKRGNMSIDRYLSIEIDKPSINIEYHGTVISHQFKEFIGKYKPRSKRKTSLIMHK